MGPDFVSCKALKGLYVASSYNGWSGGAMETLLLGVQCSSVRVHWCTHACVSITARCAQSRSRLMWGSGCMSLAYEAASTWQCVCCNSVVVVMCRSHTARHRSDCASSLL